MLQFLKEFLESGYEKGAAWSDTAADGCCHF